MQSFTSHGNILFILTKMHIRILFLIFVINIRLINPLKNTGHY